MDDHLLATMRAAPPRGERHIFLGDPRGGTADKTTVEPGNVTSPGLWTCGLTVWVDGGAGPASPDTTPVEAWELDPPVVRTRWRSGSAEVRHEVTQIAAGAAPAVDRHRIDVTGTACWWLALRGPGPAGGIVRDLRWDGAVLHADGVRLRCRPAPLEVVVAEGPLAALVFAGPAEIVVAHRGAEFPADDAAAADTAVRAELIADGTPLAAAWRRCAHHLLAAAERGLPRIGVANYPGLWLRDCVLVVHAWDLLGRHDLARAACETLAGIDFAGGFGAESDAPGQGAWLPARHAALTRDPAWLAGLRPQVERRARLIQAMRRTTVPLHAAAVDRMPRYLPHPDLDLLCRPAREGCIASRMDWHAPDFYCNAWAVAGLRAAADAARADGDGAAAGQWAGEADDLEAAMARSLLPAFGNERDPACTPWPTGALAAAVAPAVRAFFHAQRRHDGRRRGEALWTYFEAAQIHNAIRCGLRDEAWDSLLGLLADGGAVADFGEGRADGAERLPWGPADPAGWLHPQRARHGNMPHNWTCAELIAALRSVLLIEEPDGLRLGAGLPRQALIPGARFGARDLPSAHGPLTFTLTVDDDARVRVEGLDGIPHRLDLP